MLRNEIDMICFNQECIAYQNQLFLYGSDAQYQHDVHEEQCANMHPFFFNKKYVKQAPVLLEIKAEFEEQLLVAIDETVRKVADALKNKLTQKSSEVYDRELDQFRVGNCEKMFERIKLNRQVSQQISFINCLFLEDANGMKDHIVKKMKKCEEQINHSLDRLDRQLAQNFQKVINGFNFKQWKKVKTSPDKSVKVESQETPMPESSKMVEERVVEKIPAIKEDMNIQDNSSEQAQHAKDLKRKFKVIKTKPIQKVIKTIKQQQNEPQESSNQEYQESQDLSVVSKQQYNKNDDVCTIRSDFDWFDLLKNPTNFKKLVVYYPLSEENLLKAIKKATPKEIYINYDVQLSSKFIENIPGHILQQLEKFQEFWDQNEFFDEVINNHHFPTDDFRHIKSVNKIHFSKNQLDLIPKISNIWISNQYDLQQLNLSFNATRYIDSLRIETCKCCNSLNQNVIGQIFKTFKETRNLKTLILKCQVLNAENTRLLRQLTNSNKRIQSVILQLQGKFIPHNIIECFVLLPLKNLSINKERNNDRQIVYMDITPITKIRTLRKLAMTSLFFTKQKVKRSDIDSGMIFNLDEKAADKISKLTKLVFLDLFRCSPIYSNVVGMLKEKVKRQLYHLNLSYALMDSSIIYQLYSLPQLKELNMDKNYLPLKEFLREIAKKPLLSVKKLSLFNYNGLPFDQNDQSQRVSSNVFLSHLKDVDIDKISSCFPNLQYLNIAFCSHFTDLPEHKFKKLKYLCSNKEYMTPAKVERLRHKRGIEVYLYDGKYPA